MTEFILLMLAAGVAPLAAGLLLLKPTAGPMRPALRASSVVLCALAFNLTFFWQELWLVIPKALAPGLHPVLFHNDHDWTGSHPQVELLQGTGAIATLVSGLIFAGMLTLRSWSPTWRLFAFWMAFQGLYQSLSQLAVGTLLPRNDVGRALAYLQVPEAGHWALLALAVAAMAVAGAFLARRYPLAPPGPHTRALGLTIAGTTMLAIALILPFRLPRNLIEVALIPLFVHLLGAGWTVLGAALTRPRGTGADRRPSGLIGPALALLALLLVFQGVLRPGVSF